MKKRKKLEESHLPFSKLSTKLQLPKQCDTRKRTDIQNNGIELRVQKYTYTFMANCSSMGVPRPFNGERIIFSASGDRKTRYLPTAE